MSTPIINPTPADRRVNGKPVVRAVPTAPKKETKMTTPTAPKPAPSPAPAPKVFGTTPVQTVNGPVYGAVQPKVSPVMKTRFDIPKTVHPDLVEILTRKRLHGSAGEIEFGQWVEAQLKAVLPSLPEGSLVRRGALDCVVAQCMPKGEKARASDVLFSSHMDTQHAHSDNPARQKVLYDANFGHIMLDTKDPNAGACLGADDGVGVWIMLEMFRAGVPGTYVFHRGEECGGLSAHAMLRDEKEFLRQHAMAVAFDRPRTNEIIITQGGAACASERFGTALATALNNLDDEFEYEISHRGTFTDTKVYRGVISECINIGVGYEGQHGRSEMLDYAHAKALRDAAIEVEWGSLPIDRDPKAAENEWNGSRSGRGYKGYGSYHDHNDQEDLWGKSFADVKDDAWKNHKFDAWKDHKPAPMRWERNPAPAPAAPSVTLSATDELLRMSLDDLMFFLGDDVDAAARDVAELIMDYAALKARCDAYKTLLGSAV